MSLDLAPYRLILSAHVINGDWPLLFLASPSSTRIEMSAEEQNPSTSGSKETQKKFKAAITQIKNESLQFADHVSIIKKNIYCNSLFIETFFKLTIPQHYLKHGCDIGRYCVQVSHK